MRISPLQIMPWVGFKAYIGVMEQIKQSRNAMESDTCGRIQGKLIRTSIIIIGIVKILMLGWICDMSPIFLTT